MARDLEQAYGRTRSEKSRDWDPDQGIDIPPFPGAMVYAIVGAEVGRVHFPSLQIPETQVVPQLPQLPGSENVSTHIPEHSACSGAHEGSDDHATQDPLLQ